uniref:Uncharacterized protein n=1 Tax=Arundo donax TaxID=35708 RepID=A0A0A9ADT5_ARUDO
MVVKKCSRCLPNLSLHNRKEHLIRNWENNPHMTRQESVLLSCAVYHTNPSQSFCIET